MATDLGFNLGSNSKETISVMSNNPGHKFLPGTGYRLEDEGKRLVLRDDNKEGLSDFMLSIGLKLQYEILMGRWYIVPEAGYYFHVLKLISKTDTNQNNLRIGASMRFSL